MPDDDPSPNTVTRFLRWRRGHGGWVYFNLAWTWAALTFVVVDVAGWGWRAYLASGATFFLLFEVGVAYVLAAAWGSHRQLEHEGEVSSILVKLRGKKLPREEIKQLAERLIELGQDVEMG